MCKHGAACCCRCRASPLEEQREAQALSVGHLAAVNAALAAAAGLPAADGYPGRPTDMVATTVLSLIQIGEACPGAVTRALLQPVQTELLALRQVGNGRHGHVPDPPPYICGCSVSSLNHS